MVTLSSAALQGPSLASPVAALPWVPTAGAPPELPSVAGSLPVLVLLAPKLVSVVEPVLSLQLLEDAGRFAELPVDLTIRADGSVALVVVAVSAPRLLVRAVGTALEQWRFEPLPSERVHRVNLVFNAGETRAEQPGPCASHLPWAKFNCRMPWTRTPGCHTKAVGWRLRAPCCTL